MERQSLWILGIIIIFSPSSNFPWKLSSIISLIDCSWLPLLNYIFIFGQQKQSNEHHTTLVPFSRIHLNNDKRERKKSLFLRVNCFCFAYRYIHFRVSFLKCHFPWKLERIVSLSTATALWIVNVNSSFPYYSKRNKEIEIVRMITFTMDNGQWPVYIQYIYIDILGIFWALGASFQKCINVDVSSTVCGFSEWAWKKKYFFSFHGHFKGNDDDPTTRKSRHLCHWLYMYKVHMKYERSEDYEERTPAKK